MIQLTWSEFKAYFTGLGIPIRGFETSTEYIIYMADAGLEFKCSLDKSPTDTTDRDDYVNNYKASATVQSVSGKWKAPSQLSLFMAPVGVAATSNLITGIANFDFLVPGTFGGYPPTDLTKGRFLKKIEFIADTITLGDYLDTIVLSDDGGVIPVPLRGNFPSYPTLINFSTDTTVMTGCVAGAYFTRDGYIKIEPVDNGFQFLPSGLHLKGTIRGTGLKVYRVNIMWGRLAAF